MNTFAGVSMKILTGLIAGLTTLVLCVPAFGQSVSVGTLTCGDAAQQVRMDVSYYNFGGQATLSLGSQSSGAGAGKETFPPLEIHTSLGEFPVLLQLTQMGQHFSTCTLVTNGDKHERAAFEFTLLAIKSLSAVGEAPAREDATPSQYADVLFEYGAMKPLY